VGGTGINSRRIRDRRNRLREVFWQPDPASLMIAALR
jgi:hypothetical protein